MKNPAPGNQSRLTSKGRAMRERIVQSAADLMFQAGARQTSLDEVRADTGTSKSQLYHYFADKDELLRDVIEFQGQRVLDAEQPELGRIDSVVALKRWRNKVVRLADAFGRVGGCPVGSLANELATHDGTHREALQLQFAEWTRQIEHGLETMRSNRTLGRGSNRKKLSLAFLTAIQGGLLLAKVSNSTTALEAALDQLIELIEMRSAGPADK